ncbi:MAG: hypothetical protein K2X81_18715, partial [Candidatus Obscuribacterales bacterium]|nr:hypothetical protein [Candidatus Obscuribacterales bacterium]
MVSKSKSSKIKQLTELGAEKLAEALLGLADYNEDADRIVERMLTKSNGSPDRFKTKLNAIKRRKQFISWRENSAYARELESLLEDLKTDVSDPQKGLLALADFFKADKFIIEACDDSNGCVGDVFQSYAQDI